MSEANINKLVVEVDDAAKTTGGGIDSVIDKLDTLDKQVQSSSKGLSRLAKNFDKATKAAQKTNNSQPGSMSKGGGLDMMGRLKRNTALFGIGKAFSYATLAANKYIETMNLFDVVMGDASMKARGFVSALEGIGVNREESMRYQASFYDLAKSLGMSSKNAYTLSEQFTKLSYDYASLYNMSPDVAFQKLQAAAVGTVEPIRRLGKDISIAHLQQVAYNLGIEESVRNMTQSERATLRFVAVMQQSGAALNDMERTINSPANQIRVLRSQFNALAREIGALVIPALNAILPVAIAVARVMRDIVAALAALFGIKLKSFDTKVTGALNDVGAGLGVASDNAGDFGKKLGGAGKQAKKLKDYLLGIDELNVLKEDEPTGGGGGGGTGAGGIGGGGDLGLNLEDFGYKKVLDDVKSKADEVYEAFLRWKPLLKTLGGILGAIWVTGKVMKFISALKGVTNASTIAMGIRGIGGLGKSLMKLSGGSGILSLVSNGFVNLGDKILSACGIMSGSTTLAGGVAVGALTAIAVGAMGVREAMKSSVEQIEVFGSDISEVTTTKLKPFIDTLTNLDSDVKKIDWSNKIVTDQDLEAIQAKTAQLREMLLNELDADRNDQLRDLQVLKDGGLSDEAYQDGLERINKYHDDLQKQISEAEEEINAIYAKAKEEQRTTTEEENARIMELERQMAQAGIENMSESAEEQEMILARLKYNAKAITVEQGAEILQEAKKNKENLLAEAEDTRVRMLLDLDKRYTSEEEKQSESYRQQKEAIEKHFEEQAQAAEKGYNDIVSEVEKGLGDEAIKIDTKTAEIRNNGTVWWLRMKGDAQTGIDGVGSNINNGMSSIERKQNGFSTRFGNSWDTTWSDAKGSSKTQFDLMKSNWGSTLDDMETDSTNKGDNFVKSVQGWSSNAMTYATNNFDTIKTNANSLGLTLDDINAKLERNRKNSGKGGAAPASETFSLRAPEVTAFATGGFVSPRASFVSPNLFTAGEDGQELIGRYKSKKTVMPLENTSFVNAIHDAVYRATLEAMDRQQPVTVNVQPQVKIGNRDIKQAEESFVYDTGGGLIRRR